MLSRFRLHRASASGKPRRRNGALGLDAARTLWLTLLRQLAYAKPLWQRLPETDAKRRRRAHARAAAPTGAVSLEAIQSSLFDNRPPLSRSCMIDAPQAGFGPTCQSLRRQVLVRGVRFGEDEWKKIWRSCCYFREAI